jgi:hypothetical protein
MKAVKPTRAEVEATIESLLAWQNEQPEYKTDEYPDEDRTLNSVDRLRLARLGERAKFCLQDSANHKNLFQDFITAYSENTIPAMLGIALKLCDALCEIRNTLTAKRKQWTKEKANEEILRVIKKKHIPLKNITAARLHKELPTISPSTLSTTETIKTAVEERKKNKRPKVVSFTPKMKYIAEKDEFGTVKLHTGDKRSRIESENEDGK